MSSALRWVLSLCFIITIIIIQVSLFFAFTQMSVQVCGEREALIRHARVVKSVRVVFCVSDISSN